MLSKISEPVYFVKLMQRPEEYAEQFNILTEKMTEQ